MDRKPEHLTEDPHLRTDFINQLSWDEWAAIHAPFFLVEGAEELVEGQMKQMGMKATFEDALAVALDEWRRTLDPETRLAETLYLQGFSHTQRQHIVEQQHAMLVRRAVEVGLIEERQVDVDFREQFGE